MGFSGLRYAVLGRIRGRYDGEMVWDCAGRKSGNRMFIGSKVFVNLYSVSYDVHVLCIVIYITAQRAEKSL